MKVLFSNPPWWVKRFEFLGEDAPASAWYSGVRAGSRWPHTSLAHSSPDNFVFGEYMPYPFFMGHAATYVAKATGAKVSFRDSIALRESYAAYFDHLREGRYEHIFIETATPCWDHDREIIRKIKQILPDTRITLTGALSTKVDAVLADNPINAMIQGEYEKGAVRVLNGEEGLIPFDLLTVEEMNAAPIPYFDETIAHRYWDCNPAGQKAPQLQLWASRGCPYKCIFCVWPATMTGNDPDGSGKRTVRFYSPDHVEATLRELIGRYGYRSIYFDDDTFNLADKHVLGICEVMERIGLPWSAMCRADTIKLDTWRAMRDAGCFGVKLGFESGDQWVNDNIVNKRLNLETARDVVHELKRLNMTVHGTFTYGLPGETSEQMATTKAYLNSLPLDTYQETGCGEIEGTPMATLREKGALARYQGAVLDDHYIQIADGGAKMRKLSETEFEGGGGDQAKATSSYLGRQWRLLAQAIVEAAQDGNQGGSVWVWGIGTDFFEAVGSTPALREMVRRNEVRLVDGKMAGQSLEGVEIAGPAALTEDGGPVFLTPRIRSSRTSMGLEAARLGIASERLRDIYDDGVVAAA